MKIIINTSGKYEAISLDNFIKDYVNSFISLTSRASDKANYIEMILNKDFSINISDDDSINSNIIYLLIKSSSLISSSLL